MSINHLISQDIEPKFDLYANNVVLQADDEDGLADFWTTASPGFLTSPNSTFSNIDIPYYNLKVDSENSVATYKFSGTLDVDIPNLGTAKARLPVLFFSPQEVYYARFNIQSSEGAVLPPSGIVPATAKLYLDQDQPVVVPGQYIEFDFILPLDVFAPSNSYIATECTIDCEISYRY